MGRIWLLYFIFSILWIGFILAYGLAVPLFLLGLIFRPAARAADWVVQKGIHFLMWTQPWYHADLDLQLPEQGCALLIANHRSHLDAFIMLSSIQGIRMLARRSLIFIPFLNVMMILTRQIFSKRGDVDSLLLAMENVKNRLSKGERVLIFAEMTRCEAGLRGAQAFSLVPFQMAMQARVPVIPLVFKNTDRVWPKGSSSLIPHQRVKIKTLEPVHPEAFSSVSELRDHVKNTIEQELSS